MKPIGRRIFVQKSALAFLAVGLPPELLARPLLRAGPGAAGGRKTLVCIFQRGAVDGLSMVVPFGEAAYARERRSIVIPAPSRSAGAGDAALDLDGFFGLHPALEPLDPLYRQGHLAVVHAVGSPDPTRSHFDAQDYMETAAPGQRTVTDGWLNRALGASDDGCEVCRGRTLADGERHAADHLLGQAGGPGGVASALRGVAMGSVLPRSLRGDVPTLAIPDLDRFGETASPAVERLYRSTGGDLVSGPAAEAFEAVRLLERVEPTSYRPSPGVSYPPGEFGRALRQIAQLVRADVGVEIAFADLGGWDTHAGQGGARGTLSRNLDQLARGLRAFHDDLGKRMDDVVVLTMSEFGRTVAENGSGGTDHGHANCMLVLGGPVGGGRVLGEWPGLEPEQRYQGRDLAVTTDFRDVFGEVLQKHLGVADVGPVFPGYAVDPGRYRGVMG